MEGCDIRHVVGYPMIDTWWRGDAATDVPIFSNIRLSSIGLRVDAIATFIFFASCLIVLVKFVSFPNAQAGQDSVKS